MPSELYERFGTGTDNDLYRSSGVRAVLTWYFNSGRLRARTICFSHRNLFLSYVIIKDNNRNFYGIFIIICVRDAHNNVMVIDSHNKDMSHVKYCMQKDIFRVALLYCI